MVDGTGNYWGQEKLNEKNFCKFVMFFENRDVNPRKAMKNGIIFCEGKSFLKSEMIFILKNNDKNIRSWYKIR